MKKPMIGVAVTVVIAAVAGLLWQQHLLKQAAVEIEDLQERVDSEVPALQEKNQLLQEQLDYTEERLESNTKELMKLRGQSVKMRQQQEEIASLETSRDRLAQAQAQAATQASTQPQEESEPNSPDQTYGPGTSDRIFQAKHWGVALVNYAQAHEGQYPPQLGAATAFLLEGLSEADRARLLADVTKFELIYHGNSQALPAPPAPSPIVIRERLPTYGPNGEWVKVYGHADGSASVQTSRSGDFSQWEGQR